MKSLGEEEFKKEERARLAFKSPPPGVLLMPVSKAVLGWRGAEFPIIKRSSAALVHRARALWG